MDGTRVACHLLDASVDLVQGEDVHEHLRRRVRHHVFHVEWENIWQHLGQKWWPVGGQEEREFLQVGLSDV